MKLGAGVSAVVDIRITHWKLKVEALVCESGSTVAREFQTAPLKAGGTAVLSVKKHERCFSVFPHGTCFQCKHIAGTSQCLFVAGLGVFRNLLKNWTSRSERLAEECCGDR
jgi:hypothetical protein